MDASLRLGFHKVTANDSTGIRPAAGDRESNSGSTSVGIAVLVSLAAMAVLQLRGQESRDGFS